MVKKALYLLFLLVILFSNVIGPVSAAPVKEEGTAVIKAPVHGTIKSGAQLLKDSLVKIYGKGETWGQLATDAKGAFKADLQDGTYTIKGVKEQNSAWHSENKNFFVKDGKIKDGVIVLPASKQEKQPVKETPVKAGKTSEVLGKIKDNKGPLKNAAVVLREMGTGHLIKTVTDSSGSFNSSLKDGAYEIKAFKAKTAGWFKVNESFIVKEGKIKGDVVVSQKKESKKPAADAANLTGFLKEGSKGLKADLVFLKDIDNEEEFGVYVVSSKGDGSFSALLPDGNYYLNGIELDGGIYIHQLSFSVEGGKVLEDGQPQENITITLPVNAYSGTVGDSSKPLAGAHIILEKQGEEYDEFIQEVVTDKQGRFSLRALQDGTYSLSVYHDTYTSWKQLTFEVAGGTVFIDGQKAASLQLTVPDINVKGTLMDGKKPVPNAYIYLESETDWIGMPVNSKGEFQYRLKDGRYKVIEISEELRNTLVNIPFEISGGKLIQNGNVQSTLKIDVPPLTFFGKLIDSGAAVPGRVEVERVTNNGEYEWYYAATDDQGIYSLRLKDGSYRLTYGYLFEDQEEIWLSDTFDISNGKMFVNGEEQSIFELQIPPVSLHGVVKENGQPVADGFYTACSDEQGFCSGRSLNPDGTFTMRLGDGDYRFESVSLGDGTNASINQWFTIKDGKTFVDGLQQDMLEISVPPVTLKGTISDAGNPVAADLYITQINNENPMSFWGWANEEGQFKFRLPDGDYRVTDIFLNNDGTTFNPGTEFSIQSGKLYVNGELHDTLDISVPPVTLNGILAESGNPVTGQVRIFDFNNPDSNHIWAWANESGVFQSRLPDGEYEVDAVYLQDDTSFNPGLQFSIQSGQLYVNGERQETLNIAVPPITLKGTLTDSGNPVAGMIELYDLNGKDVPALFTNENGAFQSRLPDGDYRVSYIYLFEGSSFDAGIEFSIQDGKLYVNGDPKDLLEILVPPVSLNGVLMDAGSPISGDISVVELNNDNPSYYGFGTNEDGTFQYRLPDGSYMVNEVRPHDGTVFNPKLEFSIQDGKLYVNGQPQDRLEIAAPPVTLTGALSDAGNPLSGSLYIRDLSNPDNSNWVYANENGTFQSRLPDGDYLLADVYLNDGTSFSSGKEFSIIGGQLYVNGEKKDILEIAAPPVSLQGSLTDSGNPVMGDIVIESIDTENPSYFYLNTNEEGRFAGRLQDGNYRVVNVYSSLDGSSFNPEITFSIESGQLYVNGKLQGQLDISVPPVTLTGTLTESGNPISGTLYIMEMNDAESPLQFSLSANEQGSFQGRLPDGAYQVNTVYLNDGITVSSGLEFSLVSGQLYVNGEPAEQLNIAVPPVTLSGNVFNGEESVMEGYISIYSIGDDSIGGYSSWFQNGAYQFRLPDGEYGISFVDAYGYGTYSFDKTFTITEGKVFADGQEVGQLDINLQEGTQQ